MADDLRIGFQLLTGILGVTGPFIAIGCSILCAVILTWKKREWNIIITSLISAIVAFIVLIISYIPISSLTDSMDNLLTVALRCGGVSLPIALIASWITTLILKRMGQIDNVKDKRGGAETPLK